MRPPEVSIVITTCQRPELLAVSLRSIRSQRFDDYEVIVVDDGNDDRTPWVCHDLADHYIKLTRPMDGTYRNPSYPNNVGIRQAVGKVVLLQNAECCHVSHEVVAGLSSKVTANNAVMARVVALDERGNPGIVYCGVDNPRPYFFCGAIEREWFLRLGGFDEDYTRYGYEDDDLANRLIRSGVTFEFTNLLVHHQWHPPAGTVDNGMDEMAVLFERKRNEGVVRNVGREWGMP